MFAINFEKHAMLFQPQVLYWGIAHDYLTTDDAITIADKLLTGGNDNSVYIDLLLTQPTESEDALKLLARHTPVLDETFAAKILRYVILEGIATSASSVSDALDAVEEVYADFDYPSDMDPFIRYMPTDDSSLAPTKAENEQRLFETFLCFLETEKASIGAQKDSSRE